MKKVTKKIKEIDAYKREQSFNTRGDGGNEKEIGSLVGGLFTIIVIIIIFEHFGNSLHRMYLGKEDSETTRTRPNFLLAGENVINL